VSARRPRKGKRGRPWYEAGWLAGLFLVAIAIYLGLSLTEPPGPWWVGLQGGETGDLISPTNPGGPVGAVLSLGARVIFGAAWCWVLPAVLGLLGISALLRRERSLLRRLLPLVPLWLVSTAWIAQPDGLLASGEAAYWGGVVGWWLARGFHQLVGLWGGRIFLSFALLVVMLAVLRPMHGWLARMLGLFGRGLAAVGGVLWMLLYAPVRLIAALRERLARRRQRRADTAAVYDRTEDARLAGDGLSAVDAGDIAMRQRERRVHHGSAADHRPALADAAGGGLDPASSSGGAARPRPPGMRRPPVRSATKTASGPVTLPTLELLDTARLQNRPAEPAALDAAADLLEDTLRSFGVEGEVKDVRPGPVVTTFEYQPAAGIRVNQIVQRVDDLALAMKARSIRMEAPIPGKAAVGIEIPNPEAQTVGLREVLELVAGQPRKPLTVALGKDVVGDVVTLDLTELPHLLVAGSTGSGKSVCLNSMICNLLLYNEPTRLRMLLIDPKMLELNVYNGVPHLLLPVVTDPREALKAMKWMVGQMDLRYRQLAHWSVRNIEQYNEKIARGEITNNEGETVSDPMPYYLTIVDELADLMIQLGQDFELPITRLAQKARAVGIHLVLATQRPSVDVLTGVIKANIPCRVAFRVIQRNDSRTILDMNGAEQLLGRGDMLYLQPGRAQPLRVHGCFIDVHEAAAITDHWRQYTDATEAVELEEPVTSGGHRGEDDLFEDAKRIVVLHQSGSTSLLQRRLRVGYTRAGRLMDMLEEAGIVGPFTGSKARDVLLRPEELPELEEPSR